MEGEVMNYIKRMILMCEHCGKKMFDEINVNYEGDLLLIKVETCTCSSVAEFVKANTELAKLTANMIEFLAEVTYKPYKDSDALSLLESLRTRASVILQDIGKDEPLTLTDLPRPWSTDEMKESTCPGCGAPYVGGEVTTHFHFCPVEKENKPLPPEVYNDFEARTTIQRREIKK